MSDADLRNLERAAAEAPGDGRARLELALALDRAGRRRDALARLDLAQIPGPLFEETRALADSWWRDELSKLEPRVTCPRGHTHRLDRTGRWVAVNQEGGRFAVGSLETGKIVFEGTGYVTDAPATDAFFLGPGNDILERAGEGFARRKLRGNGVVLGASLDGTQMFVSQRDSDFGAHTYNFVILDAKSHEHLFRGLVRNGHRPEVDWGERLVAALWEERVRVQRLSGELVREFPHPFLHLAGRGLGVEAHSSRLAIWSFTRGWSLELAPTGSASLSSDGRGVRVVGVQGLQRCDLDFGTGTLLRESPPVEVGGGCWGWHPHADVVIQRREGASLLLSVTGERVFAFPAGVAPVERTPDGHGLLVRVRGPTSESAVQLWSGQSLPGNGPVDRGLAAVAAWLKGGAGRSRQ